jgi:hypothetical protein
MGTPVDSFEYMCITMKLILQEIIVKYNFISFVLDGHVYIEMQKGMYCLLQVDIIVKQLFARRLVIHGYHQTKFTPGLWRHLIHLIRFTVVLDNFGVQYVRQEHAQHPNDALEIHNTVSKDWTGGLYWGTN